MNIIDDRMILKDYIDKCLPELEIGRFIPELSIGDYTRFDIKTNEKKKVFHLFVSYERYAFEVINNDTINIPHDKWEWLEKLESIILQFEEDSGRTVTVHKTEGFLY